MSQESLGIRQAGIHEIPGLRSSLLRRSAAGGDRPADSAVDPGRRHSRRDRARSLEYHRVGRAADPACLEYGLRRGALAVALFPARRRDRACRSGSWSGWPKRRAGSKRGRLIQGRRGLKCEGRARNLRHALSRDRTCSSRRYSPDAGGRGRRFARHRLIRARGRAGRRRDGAGAADAAESGRASRHSRSAHWGRSAFWPLPPWPCLRGCCCGWPPVMNDGSRSTSASFPAALLRARLILLRLLLLGLMRLMCC